LTASTVSENSLFDWLVADDCCWFVLRKEYCWLVVGGWFDVRKVLLAGGCEQGKIS
jgi:hypothetical protein